MQQQIRKQAQAKTEQQITQQRTPKHSRKPKNTTTNQKRQQYCTSEKLKTQQ